MAAAASPDDDGHWRRSLEDMRVGTSVTSFEELLARELAKAPPSAADTSTSTSRSAKQAKQPFLKRGDRGWWMKRPGASARISKHVLASKDVDGTAESGSNSSSRATTYAASASQRSFQQQQPPVKKSASQAPPERQQQQRTSYAAPSAPPQQEPRRAPSQLPPPPPVSSARQPSASNAVRQSVERMSAPQLSDSMRTTASVDTLGMSRMRQSYEAQLEREADELADFEAIERELAAEKDSYLMEKQQQQVRRQLEEDGALLERNAASPWLSELRPSRHSATQRYSGFDGANLELDGHSSLLFDDDAQRFPHDDDDRFESASVFSLDQRRVSDHFAKSQLAYPTSELSAISLDDSASWGDNVPLQDADQYAHRGSSSLSQHQSASGGLLGAAADRRSHGYGSFDDAAPPYRSSDEFSDEASNQRSNHDAEYKRPRNAAPQVSELMQQFFGSRSSDVYGDDDDEYNTSRDSDHSQEEQVQADRHSAMLPRSQAKAAPRSQSKGKGKGKGSQASKAVSAAQVPRSVNAKSGAPTSARTRAASTGSAKQATVPSAKARGGAILPVVIEEKLFELEEEVKFYKAETLLLQKKKDAFDQVARKLAREREEFTRFQNEQKELMEKEWEKERLKMRRDEKLMERQVKLKLSAAASHHDRKERGEIDALKAQIVTMQLDEKARAGKWKAMNDNLRQRVVELEDKNRELGEEIKFLEKDRLEQWGKYEALLKERQRQNDPPVVAGGLSGSSRSHFDLDAERDLRTVNDLFAIKDTADALLKGWQSRGEGDDEATSHSQEDAEHTAADLRCEDERQTTDVADNDERVCAGSASKKTATRQVEREVVQPGGKREVLFTDGSRQIFFADGNEKEVDADGHTTIRFTNGDRKELFPDTGVSIYYYYEAQTTLTTFPDKTKVYEFPNQQVEKSYPDGSTEISFADGITKTIRANGDEFSVFPDGTTMLEQKDGLREVTLLNRKKIRYYPDGAMAWLTPQGRETPVRSDAELRKLMESVQ